MLARVATAGALAGGGAFVAAPPRLPAADLGAAAAAALPGGPSLTSREAQAAATDAGEVITLTAIRSSEKMIAAAGLIPLLPPYAVAAMLATSEERVAQVDPALVVSRLIGIISKTGVSTIRGGVSAWSRMLRWADELDVQTGARFDGLDAVAFLDAVHAEALPCYRLPKTN